MKQETPNTQEALYTIQVFKAPLPAKVSGFCTEKAAGNYAIVINAGADPEQQRETFLHECLHIFRNDFASAEDIQQIEAGAHDETRTFLKGDEKQDKTEKQYRKLMNDFEKLYTKDKNIRRYGLPLDLLPVFSNSGKDAFLRSLCDVFKIGFVKGTAYERNKRRKKAKALQK